MNNLYKYSQFNIEVDTKEDGSIYIFNTYTCKGMWIDKEDQKLIMNKTDIDPLDISETIIQNGLVVEVEIDELERIKCEHDKVINSNRELSIVIATTQRCNYRCHYCFMAEYLSADDMSFDTMHNTVYFILNEIKKRPKLKTVKLQWFGGEPLLNIECIKYITSKVSEYTDERGIDTECSIITNGSLLDYLVVRELHDKYKLKAAQISLEALYDEYNNNRGVKNNYFDILMSNIENAQDIIDISIRVNVINKEKAVDVINYIKNKRLNVRINYHNIWDMSQNSETYLMEYDSFIKDSIAIDTELNQMGYSDVRGNHTIHKRCIACMANMKSFFAIDIYGNLYRCLEKINDKKYVIGNIIDGITNQKINSIFIDEKLADNCSRCNYLPLCYGKCTTERVIEGLGINCTAIKQYINTKIHP